MGNLLSFQREHRTQTEKKKKNIKKKTLKNVFEEILKNCIKLY